MASNLIKFLQVSQGQVLTSDQPLIRFSTVLGSCVAVCMYDATAKVGGMNHFLLPDAKFKSGNEQQYGVNLMELLINGLMKRGARKANMEAKVFGGARMLSAGRDIGASNAKFALHFLQHEHIPCLAQSIGGSAARRIEFNPTTGHVRQRLVQEFRVEYEDAPPIIGGDVELFDPGPTRGPAKRGQA